MLTGLVLAIGNIPRLSPTSAWQGFVVQTAALTVVWVIARKPWVRPKRPTPAAEAETVPSSKQLVSSAQ